ncbi:hypothetical protein H6G27_34290 [Nostoc linckia FACHB-104]|nr:hypothetical protein [Nostoc linckia FACHB-104]
MKKQLRMLVEIGGKRLPPILLVLSLIGAGISYKDNSREIHIWLDSPNKDSRNK